MHKTCEVCHRHPAQRVAFKGRGFFMACSACHEQLANIAGAIRALRQQQAALLKAWPRR